MGLVILFGILDFGVQFDKLTVRAVTELAEVQSNACRSSVEHLSKFSRTFLDLGLEIERHSATLQADFVCVAVISF